MTKVKHLFTFMGALTGLGLSLPISAQTFNQMESYNQTPHATSSHSSQAETQYSPYSPSHQSLKIGVVNAKKCLEESKLGKHEQANFERMRQQMEGTLQDKEKDLEEIESKINDEDYMDSISDEAAAELKRKKRNIRQEGLQLQNQYLQTLQQANVKVVQKLTEIINKASELVAQDDKGETFDIIFNNEGCTYYSNHLDVSDKVIAKMDTLFEAEQKK